MARRLLTIAAFGLLLLLGCNFVPPPSTDESVVEEAARIVDHRATDPATVEKLLFTKNRVDGFGAQTICGEHDEYVHDFISRTNFGGGRMFTAPMHTIWSEIVVVQPLSGSYNSIPVANLDYNSGLVRLANQQAVQGTIRYWFLNQHKLVSITANAVYTISPREQHEFMKSGKPFDGSKATKRKLDGFELTALERLKTGADVVSQESGKTLRVFGAIKARKDCLGCHQQNKEGDMLGAFTYTLNLMDTQTPDQFTLKNLNGLREQQVAAIRQIEANSGRFTRAADGRITKLQVNVDPRGTIDESTAVFGQAISNAMTMHQARDFELVNLEHFPDLLELDVSGSLITDAGLEHLKPLTTLKKLAITNTQLTKAGMSEFRKTHPACIVVGQPIDPNAIATP